MSLATELAEALDAPKVKPPCKVGVWLATQSDEDKAAFQTFLHRSGVVTDLYRFCVRHGCDASATTFKNHCKQQCSCHMGATA